MEGEETIFSEYLNTTLRTEPAGSGVTSNMFNQKPADYQQVQSNKHDTLNQCWSDIGSLSRVCWEDTDLMLA